MEEEVEEEVEEGVQAEEEVEVGPWSGTETESLAVSRTPPLSGDFGNPV